MVTTTDDDLTAHVTVVLTTSAIPSHPSTALLDATLASLSHCTGGLDRCDLLITCDGYELSEADTSQYKWGRLTPAAAEAYGEFVGRVRARAACGEMGARRVTVLALGSHHGFGHAVRAALQQVSTELVLVLQHDWLFVAPGFDAATAAAAMLGPPRLPYVAAMSLATVDYPERVRRRYGVEVGPATVVTAGKRAGRFVPLLLLQDKPHLAAAAYLRDFVLGAEHGPARGGFPEDALGRAMLADIKARDLAPDLPRTSLRPRRPLAEQARGLAAHTEYRTYVLEQGRAVTYHLSGRKAQRAAPPCASSPRPSADVTAATAAADGGREGGEGRGGGGQKPLVVVAAEGAPPLAAAHQHVAGFVRGAAWGSAVVAGLGHAQARPPSTRTFKGRCFACGQKGHSKDFCPQRAPAVAVPVAVVSWDGT